MTRCCARVTRANFGCQMIRAMSTCPATNVVSPSFGLRDSQPNRLISGRTAHEKTAAVSTSIFVIGSSTRLPPLNTE